MHGLRCALGIWWVALLGARAISAPPLLSALPARAMITPWVLLMATQAWLPMSACWQWRDKLLQSLLTRPCMLLCHACCMVHVCVTLTCPS